jgi:uncharacterized protein YjbI with pentapeptide repeats
MGDTDLTSQQLEHSLMTSTDLTSQQLEHSMMTSADLTSQQLEHSIVVSALSPGELVSGLSLEHNLLISCVRNMTF